MQFLNDLIAQWGGGNTPWAQEQMRRMQQGGMPTPDVAATPSPAMMPMGQPRPPQVPMQSSPMQRQAPMRMAGERIPAAPTERAPEPAAPSMGTYMAGALRGAAQANNPVAAILGAVGGAMGAGDEVGQANQTYRLLVSKGVPEADAALAVKNPRYMQQLLGQLAQQNQPMSEADRLDLEVKRAQLDKLRTAQPEVREVNGRLVRIGPNGAEEIYSAPQPAQSQQTPADREAMARQYGLDINSDAGRSYILTGKLPREDQQMLTATDKKAILEADEMTASTQAAITNLERALQLSGKAYDGATANERAWLTSQFGSDAGNATRELNQTVTETALQQLKAIFGGAPTEGERKILLEIQGAAEQPQPVRDAILSRAKAAAEKRLAFNRQRAEQLRGGTFYKPQAEGGPQPAPSGMGGAPIRAKNAQGDVIEFNGKEWVPVQ